MRFLLLFLLASSCAFKASALEWQPPVNGDFTLAFAEASDGFWVGTEDKGLWHRQSDGRWENVPLPVGEGAEVPAVTALAVRGDQLWIGTGRDGLFVLEHDQNDKTRFKQFSPKDGLPDPHINDIEVNAGTVWIATERGLVSYDDTKKWRDFSLSAAKINEQTMAVAVKEQTVFVATACDGLRVSRDGGESFVTVAGPKYQPNTPIGAGLPSQVLNDVCFDSLGNVWVATDYGVARSNDDGKSWFFLRGENWKQNVEGSAQGFKPQPATLTVETCGEDWVQCLRPTSDGKVWLGFRQKGAEMRDAATAELLYATWGDAKVQTASPESYVRDIFPLHNGRAIMALYGGGVAPVLGGDFPTTTTDGPTKDYPLPAEMPDAFRTRKTPDFEGGAFDGIDRVTRGDWVGKYGTQLSRIYYVDFQSKKEMGYKELTTTGPHRAGTEKDLYVYIHWLSSENPNVLFAPSLNTRRQAEINDGTWSRARYPLWFDGPGLWIQFEIPEGVHRVSPYWFNKDGHNGDNRYRDHVLRLKKVTHEADEAQEDEELAKCRWHDGWNGQYASFLVKGPGKFRIEIERHRSHATIVQGFFIDKISP